MSDSSDVVKLVQQLSQLVNPTKTLDKSKLENVLRLLRPANNSYPHAKVVKTKLMKAILHNADNVNEGPILAAKFEQDCDLLHRLNPSLLNPFLTMIHPLSFKNKSNLSAQRIPNTILSDNRRVETGKLSALTIAATDTVSGQQHNNMNKTTAAGLLSLPFDSNPNQLVSIGQDLNRDAAAVVWMDRATELLILKDLLYIFQVIIRSLTN